MKKYSLLSFCLLTLIFAGCFKQKHDPETTIVFGTSGEYPPFEFYKEGELAGFDIDLGNQIAQKLNKKAIFEDIPFETILGSLQNGSIDAGLSMFTITPERQKAYDCSIPYYTAGLSVVFKEKSNYASLKDLPSHESIGAQVGSTQELFVKKEHPKLNLVTMNNNYQLVEALKAGHVSMVILDEAQAKAFVKKNSDLASFTLHSSGEPNGIILLKNSPLTESINKALQELKQDGTIDQLIQKWVK